MTTEMFFQKGNNDRVDFFNLWIDFVERHGIDYCLVGGLAVNAYCEFRGTVDMDMVVADLERVLEKIKPPMYAKPWRFFVKVRCDKSDLTVQLQKHTWFKEYLKRAVTRKVLGRKVRVACLKDLIASKEMAVASPKRNKAKQFVDQRDLVLLKKLAKKLEAKATKASKNAK